MYKNIKKLLHLLKKKKITLSTAESCTGGMLAEVLTSNSGSSKTFKFGIITYSNQSKIKYLKVPPSIINKYGAVSEECCYSMLYNLSKISKTKINVATTGIAGPTGGSKLKPVGLVYIGIKNKKNVIVKKFQFKNKGRAYLQKATVKKALYLISKSIK
jgi:nicotinamide-nucleotide amidase